MRTLYYIALGGMLGGLFGGLLGGCEESKVRERVLYVSILPLKGLVGEIVGSDFPIEILVPHGASPETFEPTPKQFIALNNASLIFNVGLIDFEATLLSKIENREKIINLSRGIDLISGSCSHTGHAHAHGIDPHIWSSPKALRVMAQNAYEAIHRIYPDSAKYTANYEHLQQRLEALDRRVGEKIAGSGVKYFIIYHPALTYYARDYGIEQVAIEAEGKEPSAKRLAQIIEQARAAGVRYILYQSQFPASAVEVIAHDIGAESVEINPLREDIIDNLVEITDIICSK